MPGILLRGSPLDYDPIPSITVAMSELPLQPSVKPKVVRTYTFGCKVNQYDTSVMEARLRGSGDFEIGNPSETPNVVVVNTCTVTAEADRQARQLIRRVHREHPNAEIVVTGCYSESKPEILGELEGVEAVVPISEQGRLPEILGSRNPTSQDLLVVDSSRTRATLKMQDGCNAYCSFCILPYIRGRSRSEPLQNLCCQAAELERRGYRELVLTGTDLAAYGRDLRSRVRFSHALVALVKAAPKTAIRISSIERTAFTRDLIRVVSSFSQIRPHFHIPIQSGSDAVLRRMNRKYTTRMFSERVRALANTRERVAIGADVIAGFPGETEKDFEDTCRLVRDGPVSYLHVFPFSSRPGTKAAAMQDDVPSKIKKERVQILRKIGFEKKTAFYHGFLGRVESVLVEHKRDEQGLLTGHTPHYVSVRLPGDDSLMAREVPVKLHFLVGDTPENLRMVGEVVRDVG